MEADDGELISQLKKSWAEFTATANRLTSRGYFVSVENGWEFLDAPIDEDITLLLIEKPRKKDDPSGVNP